MMAVLPASVQMQSPGRHSFPQHSPSPEWAPWTFWDPEYIRGDNNNIDHTACWAHAL